MVMMKKLDMRTKWLIIIIALFLVGCSREEVNIDEEKTIVTTTSINIADRFIEYLFTRDENVLDITTGSAKKNIYNNLDNIKRAELIKVNNIVEAENDNFSIVHSTIEYENDNGINVVFYRLKLINTDEGYFVYKVEDAEPIFADDTYSSSDNDDMFTAIDGYFKSINDNKLESGTDYLIGKAKRNHLLTYDILSDVKTLSEVSLSNVKYNKLYDNGKLALVEVDYNINNKDASVIFTLYNTHQGWLIYDVEQI